MMNQASSTKFEKLELDRLIRKMKLSKENRKILLSFFKDNKLLAESFDVVEYEKEIEIKQVEDIARFLDEISGNPFIKNIYGLLELLNYDYKPDEWLLYSKYKNSRLKCLLIHKHKKYDSLPFLGKYLIASFSGFCLEFELHSLKFAS